MALDNSNWDEVVGTLAGDDTVLVICPDASGGGDCADSANEDAGVARRRSFRAAPDSTDARLGEQNSFSARDVVREDIAMAFPRR